MNLGTLLRKPLEQFYKEKVDDNNKKKDENKIENNPNNNEYEILPIDYPIYDLFFKVIIIGNFGKKINI